MEILLILAFGLLVYAIVVPKIGSVGATRSRTVAAAADIHGGIKTALDHYKMDTGYFPKSLTNLIKQSSDITNWHGPYFDPPQIPIDPWGDEYVYEFPGKHNTNGYDLLSAGPDGKAGTEDDVENWTK